jgi:hypothetical protein
LLPLAACAVLAALLVRLAQRLRATRDRRRIRLDLQKRRCAMLSVRRTRGSYPPPALAGITAAATAAGVKCARLSRAYDVEFTDLEGDHGEGVCYVGRAGLRWNEDGIGPGVVLQVAGADLPEYGQNWRG